MSSISDEDLATAAEKVRKALGMGMSGVLDVYSFVLKLRDAKDSSVRIKFEEVATGLMRGALARAIPAKRTIQYIHGLWDKLREGNLEAAQIFLEEIAHILLRHDARVLDHAVGYSIRLNSRPEVVRMENEAEKFVWFVQAPIAEAMQVNSAGALIRRFAMTPETAEKYFSHIRSAKDKYDRKPRELPNSVIDFLARQRPRLSNNKQPKIENEPIAAMNMKTQYSGYSHIACKNCGLMAVVQTGGCQHCTNCGEEDGCG